MKEILLGYLTVIDRVESHLIEPFFGLVIHISNQLIDPVKVKSNIHGHLDHRWTAVKVIAEINKIKTFWIP